MQERWRADLIDYVRQQAKPLEKYGHQPRLYALTLRIGELERYDDDVVFAAVWLHDLGVFVGHRPESPELLARWDNTAYAMEKAPGILLAAEFPGEKVAAVLAAIATHQPAGEPGSIEATIVRDADILEQLGAVGALRTICKVGRDTRFQSFSQAVESLQHAVEVLPQMVRLPQSRALAEARASVLRAFLAAASEEAGPYLG